MTPVAPPISAEPSVAVLIWGATHVHTQDHRDAVARHPRARLAAEFSDDGGAPDPAAQAAGIDWDGVDAVILDGRTGRHAAQVRAVPAGIPVLVEKPLGVDAAAAAEVAAALEGRPHSVGFFQHLLPATRRWIGEVRAAVEHGQPPERITVDFGHDGRVSGMFTGEHAWMVDPARGGSGNFLDLGLHLVHLARRLGLGELEPVACALEPAVDGLSDAGGAAVLRAGATEIRLSVTANERRTFTARAEGPAGAPTWEVRGGTLTRDGAHVLTGGGPDAAIAATAFLDAVAGVEGPLTPTDAPEALAVQELVEALQALA